MAKKQLLSRCLALLLFFHLIFLCWTVDAQRHTLQLEWFRSLGALHLHFGGTSRDTNMEIRNCSSRTPHHDVGCRLSLRRTATDNNGGEGRTAQRNMSLVYVRSHLSLPRVGDDTSIHPRDALHTEEDATRLELQCYMTRVHYSIEDAFQSSLSMHSLAAQAVRDLHRRKEGADSALTTDGRSSGGLLRSTVLNTHQVHHRLRNLARKRMDAAGEEESDGAITVGGNSLQREEGRVFEALEHQEEDLPPVPLQQQVSLFSTSGLCLSAAAAVFPFEHPSAVQQKSFRQHSGKRNASCTSAAHFVEQSNRSSSSWYRRSHLYAAADDNHMPNAEYWVDGDLAVARYMRTNNWKFCRNVQHGTYFNVTAAASRPLEDKGLSPPYSEYRCLVAHYLADVCLLLEPVDDPRDAHRWQWRLAGGCADNHGATFHYATLKHSRADAMERPSDSDVFLPLTIRVCHDYRTALQHNTTDAPGASYVHNGCRYPSFEYARRRVLEAYESQYGAFQDDHTLDFDWRSAAMDGMERPEPASWSALWGMLLVFGGIVVCLACIMCNT